MLGKDGPRSEKRKVPPTSSDASGANGSSSRAAKGAAAALAGATPPPRKRAKTHAAREIPLQPVHEALKDGEVDLQAFLNAREFEIRSLEESMRLSRSASMKRAFQLVPRSLRRRTASHNAKRVPKRLRRRTQRDMLEDNTPTVTARRRKPRSTRARIRAETAKKLGVLAAKKRKKRMAAASRDPKETATATTLPVNAAAPAESERPGNGVARTHIETRPPRPKIRRDLLNEPQRLSSKFRKRQINKTWLPTHVWHAKRARMTDPQNPLWRFALPLTPNEKVYRQTHRSQGSRGAVVWDMSYMSTIGLHGPEAGLERILRLVGVDNDRCWSDAGAKWRRGVRSWSGMLSRAYDGNRREICPATIVWNPEVTSAVSSHSTEISDTTAPQIALPKPPRQRRQLLLRIHPAAFLQVFDELVRVTRAHKPRVHVEDLRFELGSIELTGPASTECLLGILRPYYDRASESRQQHAIIYESLSGLTNPASTPPDSLLAFCVQDPRLSHPPRTIPPPDDKAHVGLCESLAKWPTEVGLRPYPIFDRDARSSASYLPSQKSLDRRKRAEPPGSRIPLAAADPPIPIMLLASRTGPGSIHSQGVWTVLVPWRCVLPIWYALVRYPISSGSNPRFGGLDELRQVSLERGRPCFPFDFLGTDAGAAWEADMRSRRKREWERRPKNKRVAWESLPLGAGRKGELGDGWSCDFGFLLGRRLAEMPATPDVVENNTEPVNAEVNTTGAQIVLPASQSTPDDAGVEPESSLYKLQNLSRAEFNALLMSPSTPISPPFAILTVKISFPARGAVSPCARIYCLPDPPATMPVASSAEVPATEPPSQPVASRLDAQSAVHSLLPPDLRSQWLSQLPATHKAQPRSLRKFQPPTSRPPLFRWTSASLAENKQLLARVLTAPPAPSPSFPAATASAAPDLWGTHPVVPDEPELIGFVTAGSYSLSEGRSVAIGFLVVERLLRSSGVCSSRGSLQGHARVCVVRNAGESVGRVATWEAL